MKNDYAVSLEEVDYMFDVEVVVADHVVAVLTVKAGDFYNAKSRALAAIKVRPAERLIPHLNLTDNL